MELYLKQNKSSFNTKLYFYDKQDNLCYRTSNGINQARNGIYLVDEFNNTLIEITQEKKLFQAKNYHIKLSNGETLNVKDKGLFRNIYEISEKMIT